MSPQNADAGQAPPPPPGDDAAARNGQHRAANFMLVPFAAKLFAPPGSEPIPPVSAPLPLDDPQALTAEAVASLQSIFRNAALSFLFRERGARVLPIPAADGERAVERRAWTPDAWGETALSFSRAAVELTLGCYALFRRPAPSDAEVARARQALRPTAADANGDAILRFLAWRRLREAQRPVESLRPFYDHALVAMERWAEAAAARAALDEAPSEQHPALAESLFADAFLPALPWIAAGWAKPWSREEERRWVGGLSGFRRAGEAQRAAFEAWIGAAAKRGRADLLLPLLEFHARLYPTAESVERDLDRFVALVADLRAADRQEAAAAWEASLTPALLLRQQRDRARATHPIDRGASDKILLQAWGELEFDAVVERLRRLVAEAKRPFATGAAIAADAAPPETPNHEPVLPRGA